MCKFSKEVQKKAAELRPIDHTLFRLIAAKKEVCQEILRTLLEDEGLVVVEVTPQKTVTSLFREVILDVLYQLGNKKFCNIEVQKGSQNDDIRRVRFHASAITASKTQKSTEFSNVPDVAVVYITEYDALRNRQATTPVKRCQRIGNSYEPIDDGKTILFANTEVNDNSEKAKLLQLFLEKDAFYSDKYPEFSKAVRYYKKNKEVCEKMCAIVEEYAQKKAMEAAKKTAKKTAIVMIRHGEPNDYISEATGLSFKKIDKLREHAEH